MGRTYNSESARRIGSADKLKFIKDYYEMLGDDEAPKENRICLAEVFFIVHGAHADTSAFLHGRRVL